MTGVRLGGGTGFAAQVRPENTRPGGEARRGELGGRERDARPPLFGLINAEFSRYSVSAELDPKGQSWWRRACTGSDLKPQAGVLNVGEVTRGKIM